MPKFLAVVLHPFQAFVFFLVLPYQIRRKEEELERAQRMGADIFVQPAPRTAPSEQALKEYRAMLRELSDDASRGEALRKQIAPKLDQLKARRERYAKLFH
jgi:beta-galactosidase GanA